MQSRLLILKESLDNLREGYGPVYLQSDPLLYLHQYDDPGDQEVVGFLAAVFAYGHVPQILQNLRRILEPLPGSVSGAIREGSVSRWKRLYKGYAYRFQQRDDLVLLLWLIKRLLLDFGSIQSSFLRFYLPNPDTTLPLRQALTEWVCFLREKVRSHPEWNRLESPRGIYHLLPDPASGSPCKRWNLYLRWMVRGPDGLDLGLWKSIPSRQLILPLDTHTARICRYLRLTSRNTSSWAMAEEITQGLRKLDPRDPVRYDFSIARLGILARCTRRIDRSRCASCELTRICHGKAVHAFERRIRKTGNRRSLVSRQRGSMVP